MQIFRVCLQKFRFGRFGVVQGISVLLRQLALDQTVSSTELFEPAAYQDMLTSDTGGRRVAL